MKNLISGVLTLTFGLASVAQGLEVFYAGSITSSDYSDAGTDLGNEGYWFANFNAAAGVNTAPPEQDAVSNLPSYVTLSFGDGADSAGGWGGYADLTLPDGTAGNSGALEINNAGNPPGNQEEYMTLTFGPSSPTNVRLGVVIDNSDGAVFSNSQIVVNGVATGPITTNNLTPDVKFFDVLNIADGDSLQIDGINSTASVSHLGGVLLDELTTIDLEVNTATGLVRILADQDRSVKGYSIRSDSGSLNPAMWDSLEDDPSFGNGDSEDGVGWEKLGAGLPTKVGEYNLMASSIFGPSGEAALNLGRLFTPGGDEDLQMAFTQADGRIVNGNVFYVSDALDGDYNFDGTVNLADYTVWRDSLGATGANLNADGDGNGTVDANDYAYWKQRFSQSLGAGAAALASATVVPEPHALVVILLMCGGLLCSKGWRRRSVMTVVLAMLSTSTLFAAENDREYYFGDAGTTDPAQGASVGEGNSMGFSFAGSIYTGDELGPSGGGYIDLEVFGPTYTSTQSRPGGSSGDYGASFDGTNDYLMGERLGIPSTSDSSTVEGGPFDYTGISNRGFQFWVHPDSSGNGSVQALVSDTEQHAVRISADGTWVMQYGGTQYDSGIDVGFNEWAHVMLVRPFGPSGATSGSILYVDGVAVTAAPGGYTGADDTPLVLGANTGTDPGTADFFNGTIDDLEMFVLGQTTGDPAIDYGNFDLAMDNDFINSLSLAEGDLTDDGLVNDDDVSVFVANWREEQVLNGRRTGDLTTRMLGDFDYDGFVGLADWQVIRDTHVNGASLNLVELLNGAQVPEPGSISIILLAILAMGARQLVLGRPSFKFLLIATACGAMLLAEVATAANQWNVDFQGDTTSGGLFGQTDTVKNFGPDPESGVWNYFSVPALSTDPQVNFATDMQLLLDDNDGNSTPVSLTLNGDYAGWNGGSGAHPLFGDYIILLGNGILGFPSPPLSMTIGGLDPGVDYGLRIITGNVSNVRDGLVTVDTDGDGSLANNSATVAPSNGVATAFSFTSAADGTMVAEMDLNSAVESNLAGLQLKVGDFEPILTVDRQTGQLTLTNNTNEAVTVTAYSIESNTAGALDPAEWLSITDNYDASSSMQSVDASNDWAEFTVSSDRDNLSEYQTIGDNGATIVDDQTIDLGTAWIRNPNEDLSMTMLLDDGTQQEVDVRFVGDPLSLGDLDFDQDVDLDDWALMKTGFSTDLTDLTLAEKFGLGDLNSDGDITLADIDAFEAAFDAGAGAGAFAAAMGSTTVPEPSAIGLALVAAILGLARPASARVPW